MSDTLEIFGTEYTNVAGFKATDDNNQTKTYIRPQGTKSISANGTGIDVTAYAAVDVAVPAPSPSLQTKTKSYTPSETAQSETVSADTGYDGIDEISISVGAISSTYVGSGVTRQGATTYRAGTSQQTIASGTYLTGTQTIAAVSQTNLTAENIKSGTTISISNGQSDIWSVTGSYTGGGSVSVETKTVTNNDNTATSISFTSLKGTPKYWFLKLNTQVSSSGSTSYYYVVDMRYNGSNTYGNCFRIGSTRRVEHITSGYSGSYSGTTLTISTTGSRTASPGSFYNGTYELTYIY